MGKSENEKIDPKERHANVTRLDVMLEFSKTVVVLSSGLLALSVSFADKLLDSTSSIIPRALLISTWVLLMLAIISGLLSMALLSEFLGGKSPLRRCVRALNFSFVLLACSGALVAALGIVQLARKSSTPTAQLSVESAKEFLRIEMDIDDEAIKLDTLAWLPGSSAYEIRLSDLNTNEKYVLEVDRSGTRIANYQRLP